jgi:hypothetical protein
VTGRRGYVYVLHFNLVIGNPTNPRAMAGHYIGHARDLERRIRQHRAGHAAAITRYLHEQGIGFLVAAVVPGGRELERKIKARKRAGGGVCGACTRQPWERAS